jgi:hypothetical protein
MSTQMAVDLWRLTPFAGWLGHNGVEDRVLSTEYGVEKGNVRSPSSCQSLPHTHQDVNSVCMAVVVRHPPFRFTPASALYTVETTRESNLAPLEFAIRSFNPYDVMHSPVLDTSGSV